MAVLLMFMFGVTIGVATFIENDYGTQTARALVYNALWFEIFLFAFIAILTYHMIRFRSYKNKLPVFLFHASFLIIALGAVVTRYIGYEGMMHIREGESSSVIVTDTQFLDIGAESNGSSASFQKMLHLSSMTSNHLEGSLDIGGKSLDFKLLEYLPSATKAIIDDPNGKKILEFKVASGEMQGKIVPLHSGEMVDIGEFVLSYNTPPSLDKPHFAVSDTNGSLWVQSSFKLSSFDMDTKNQIELEGKFNRLETRHLYQFASSGIVLKGIHEKGKVVYENASLKPISGSPQTLRLQLNIGDKTKEVELTGTAGVVGETQKVELDGVTINLSYGSKALEIPFEIRLVKFDLERYPGSMTPSSYASDVILIDKSQTIEEPHRIYMNHVLDHRGYRFFQSSYDRDEKGTILSVNHDPGTLPTYIGYLLLTIGMLWVLFLPNGRFRKLLGDVKKLQSTVAIVVVGFFLGATPTLYGATVPDLPKIDIDHALEFGRLATQDTQGRMKPVSTLAHEVVAKITGKSSFLSMTPEEMYLGMTMRPDLYQNIEMIKIGHPLIAKNLGLDSQSKYAKFSDFFGAENSYKLFKDISEANRKKPLDQSQYDKELIKIDERVNVSYMVYTGTLLQIFPLPKDKSNGWKSPVDAFTSFPPKEAQMVQLIMKSYFVSIEEAIAQGDWSKANNALDVISKYQSFYGGEVLPSPEAITLEIYYNQLGLFGKLVPYYLILGLLLLVLGLYSVIKPFKHQMRLLEIGWWILGFGFLLHIVGMGIRWYIADHAPWSNAYESIIFIAASTVLAGLMLARRSSLALSGATILAGITMGVAHMSFINPEITNLVPVLKSYWLMIHVATIISGDGFLGLGSVLSLIVLMLFIWRDKGGGSPSIDRSIKELTALSEMSLIIGLILMTVGNFLGGVWANESWGRYWGWDPKETWAAVTILIYATVLHLRFIPKLSSIYVYNLASIWAYSSVLMTYFGVNYYLSGLHSYAAGDPIPFPAWAWYSIGILLLISIAASRKTSIPK